MIRTHQDLITLAGRKGMLTHLFDLYSRAHYRSLAEFGVKGEGAIETDLIQEAIETVAEDGGGLIVPPPPAGYYLVDDDIGLTTGDTPVHIVGFNPKIKRAPTNNAYNMFRFRSNMTIEGIDLEGYIASGTGESNVVPQWGMGFRSDEHIDNVRFIRVKAHGFPFDGFYFEDEHGGGHVILDYCSGYDNYRNDFSGVRGRYFKIDGGEWGNDSFVIGKNASIDFEPDAGEEIGRVVVQNLKCYHKVAFSGLVGVNSEGEARNLIFDGSIYGSACGLLFDNYKTFRRGDIQHINGAAPAWMNAVHWNTVGASGQRVTGKFITEDRIQPQGPNLIDPATCNVAAGWDSLVTTGAATATDGVAIGDHQGIRLENSGGGKNYLVKNVAVTVGEIYSFGCLIREDIGGGPAMGMWVKCNGAAGSYAYPMHNGPTEQGVVERICGALTIPAGTTSVDVYIGSDHTAAYDIVFADVYFCKGLVDNEAIGVAWA